MQIHVHQIESEHPARQIFYEDCSRMEFDEVLDDDQVEANFADQIMREQTERRNKQLQAFMPRTLAPSKDTVQQVADNIGSMVYHLQIVLEDMQDMNKAFEDLLEEM